MDLIEQTEFEKENATFPCVEKHHFLCDCVSMRVEDEAFFLKKTERRETSPFCLRGCLWPADLCLLRAGPPRGCFPNLPGCRPVALTWDFCGRAPEVEKYWGRALQLKMLPCRFITLRLRKRTAYSWERKTLATGSNARPASGPCCALAVCVTLWLPDVLSDALFLGANPCAMCWEHRNMSEICPMQLLGQCVWADMQIATSWKTWRLMVNNECSVNPA